MTADTGLRIDGLRAGYGAREIVHGIDMSVAGGSIAILLGANGAGKSTTLGAVMGRVQRNAGYVGFGGTALPAGNVSAVVQSGIQLVPEGGRVFGDLSVRDNLRLGAYSRNVAFSAEHLRPVFEVFPRLEERQEQLGGTLSGGERQMLAIGRALMAAPQLILLDEPFLGLAPVAINDVVAALQRINRELGISMLIVEQNVKALEIADVAYLLTLGEIAVEEHEPRKLLSEGSSKIQESFLGGEGRDRTA